MKITAFEVKYDDVIPLDSAFPVAHINYGKSPSFNGISGKDIAISSRKGSLSSLDYVPNVLEIINKFADVEESGDIEDLIELWKAFWLEYIQVFDSLCITNPNSVVTAYIGRHTIELGFKYLLLCNKKVVKKTHALKELFDSLFDKLDVEPYLMNVSDFCEKYDNLLEGGNVEFFRFPEYGGNKFFAGNRLDIHWLSYSFSLIITKLLHYSGLDY